MEPPDSRLSDLGDAVAEAQDAVRRQRSPLGGARPAFERAIATGALAVPAERSRSRARRVMLVIAAVAVMAGIAAGAQLVVSRRAPALSFVVGAAAENGRVGAWIAAPPSGDLKLVFSDGATLILEARAHARVMALAASGARVLIESGRVLASTGPERGRWTFQAGPLAVEAAGARLAITWDPASEGLTATVFDGAADIHGDCLAAPRRLAPGDSLQVSCVRGSPAAGGAGQ